LPLPLPIFISSCRFGGDLNMLRNVSSRRRAVSAGEGRDTDEFYDSIFDINVKGSPSSDAPYGRALSLPSSFAKQPWSRFSL